MQKDSQLAVVMIPKPPTAIGLVFCTHTQLSNGAPKPSCNNSCL